MMKRFPLSPFPRGWYQVAASDELCRGQLKSVRFFNKEFIIFRGQSGVVQIMDAHCPHLGAHLGKGGQIIGDSIRCPFHGWRFNQLGECIGIPYCDHIPKNARLKRYETREVGQAIFLFYDSEMKESDFDLPPCEEFNSSDWSKPIRLSYILESHVQEMAENTVDTGHFPLIHSYFQVPQISEFNTEGPKLNVRFAGMRKVFGFNNNIDVSLDSFGLGVVFGKTVTDLITVYAIHCATPIDGKMIQVNVSFVFKKKKIPGLNLLLRLLLPAEVFRFTKGDHEVLNFKKYREKPVLCRNDGPIMKLRQWAKQFYNTSNETHLIS